MTKTWNAAAQPILSVPQRLAILALRIERLHAVKQLQRTQAVINAIVPPEKPHE